MTRIPEAAGPVLACLATGVVLLACWLAGAWVGLP
jgi:hypothetical protein